MQIVNQASRISCRIETFLFFETTILTGIIICIHCYSDTSSTSKLISGPSKFDLNEINVFKSILCQWFAI